MARAHFDDGDFRIGRHSQDSKRNTYVVVKIAAGRMGAKSCGQYGIDEFLRRCLAVRPCKAQNGNGKPVAVVAGKCSERQNSVRNRYETRLVRGRSRNRRVLVNDSVGGTCFKCLESILIAVKILSLQCKKKLSTTDFSTVGRNLAPAGGEYII